MRVEKEGLSPQMHESQAGEARTKSGSSARFEKAHHLPMNSMRPPRAVICILDYKAQKLSERLGDFLFSNGCH
jgi:hypothetical protein